MKKEWIRKSLSVIAKILILALSIWFLYQKVDFGEFEHAIKKTPEKVFPTLGVFALLWILNLYLDALFWAKIHRMVENVSFLRATKINLICYSLNFITPAQGGDIAGRYLMMSDHGNRKKSFFLNLWMYLPKLFARLLVSSLALGILLPLLGIISWGISLTSLIVLWTVLLWLYFSIKKLQKKLHFKNIGPWKLEHYLLDGRPNNQDKFRFLVIAAGRFLTYNCQFALILYSYSPEILPIEIWLAIPVYYLIGSLLPSFAFADFILKSAIAVWLFQPILDNEGLLMISILTIWTINIALPAFIGVYFILKTDLYRSFKMRFSRGNRNELER